MEHYKKATYRRSCSVHLCRIYSLRNKVLKNSEGNCSTISKEYPSKLPRRIDPSKFELTVQESVRELRGQTLD